MTIQEIKSEVAALVKMQPDCEDTTAKDIILMSYSSEYEQLNVAAWHKWGYYNLYCVHLETWCDGEHHAHLDHLDTYSEWTKTRPEYGVIDFGELVLMPKSEYEERERSLSEYDHELGVPQDGGAYAEDAGIYGWDLD